MIKKDVKPRDKNKSADTERSVANEEKNYSYFSLCHDDFSDVDSLTVGIISCGK